jgi:hypothetical protein
MNAQPGMYPVPAHGWTCFHCGETFMHERAARDHFGATPDREPGCVLRLTSEDRSLIRRLRAYEAEVEHLRHDIEFETTASRVFSGRLQSLLNSYAPFRGCRSLQDVFNRYDSMEGRALAAEEKLAALTVNASTSNDF